MNRIWIVVLIATVFGLSSSAQNALSFSGTVFAAPNSSLQNTVVLACFLQNNECSDSRSKFVQISSTKANAPFNLSNLEKINYLLLAWRDLNKDGEVTKGDELAIYMVAGKPKLIQPPLAKLELRLSRFSGDVDAILAQANQTPVAQTPKAALTFSGQVLPQAGSSLQSAIVFACLVVNSKCDTSRSKGVPTDAAGNFSIANLEALPYGLFAWQDTDNDGNIGAGDEFGVYSRAGQVAAATPPLTGLTLQLKAPGLTDYNAMWALFAPAASAPNPPAPTSSSGSNLIAYTIPSTWRSTGNGNFEADFNGQGYLFDANNWGKLYMQIFPSEAKNGGLAAQTRSIYQRETKGSLDVPGKTNGAFVRRLSSGLNTGVTTGSAGKTTFPDGKEIWVYSVMFLVEVGNRVIPIFFKLEREKQGVGYISNVYEGRAPILEFMKNVRPSQAVQVSPIYTEKDVLGKWKIASNLYNSTDYVNANTGAYISTSWTATSFSSKVNLQTAGVGTYFAQLVTMTNGSTRVQTESEKARWRVVGDLLIIERPASKRIATYQLYGIGRDDKNQPVLLSKYRTNDKADDLDGVPEDLWVVDK